MRFDEVILATGYRSAVDAIVPAARPVLNRHGHPSAPWFEDALDGLYFAGFDGYSTGGLLRSIRLEAPGIAGRIASNAC